MLHFNIEKRIHFSEPDSRVHEAVKILKSEGFLNISLPDETELHPSLSQLIGEKQYLQKISRDVLNAARKLRDGECDIVIGGNISSTRDIILSGAKIVELVEGITRVTSLMLLTKGEEVLGFSDCAVINDPSSEELCDITQLSSVAFEKITEKHPKIGLLSFATKGSATTLEVEKVQKAVSLIQEKYPHFLVNGPLQFDTAYSPRVAAVKDPTSDISGTVNLFIFPTLDAGNIGYKIAEQLGGYQAIGPILLGMKKPYLDLSRGCSTQDIVELSKISTLL